MTAPPEFSPLSLHAPLPIYRVRHVRPAAVQRQTVPDLLNQPRLPLVTGFALVAVAASRPRRPATRHTRPPATDRKSTRLNSSHANISYAVFCLKKKI